MYEEERMFPFWNMLLLIFIYEKQTKYLQILHDEDFLQYETIIRYLEKRGYVKKFGPRPADITLRKHGEDLFKKYVGSKKKEKEPSTVNTWIDSWREIFPPGSNTTGYRYRGNRLECLKKMVKFVDSHEKVSEEEIFQATKDYVEKFAMKGYAFMQQAHYFIMKENVGSTLESEVESLKERKDTGPQKPRYGERIV
jgi:hypothetical protein